VPAALVTGSGGLVGSESVRQFSESGFDVVGLENDMRARFFGPDASTRRVTQDLLAEYDGFRSLDIDIRDAQAVDDAFHDVGPRLGLIVHAAAQPSHDWAVSDPFTDFAVSATGTLNLYGDRPNALPLLWIVRCTRCLACRRPRLTCLPRSTAGISGCLPCAFALVA